MNIDDFLDKENSFAIVGVSANRDKWSSKIYRTLKSLGYKVYPINPKYEEIDNDVCEHDLISLSKKLSKPLDVVITVVPPAVTEQIVRQCKKLHIKKVWMQPGSESRIAIDFCKNNDIQVVHDTCFVVDGLHGDFK